MSRKLWLASDAIDTTDLVTPVPYVIIQHTATGNCSTQAQCKFFVKEIQKYHMDSYGWWDIAYNFLVGGDGLVYEGRGWTYEGSHTKSYNKVSIGIGFIGTFNKDLPPERQLLAAKLLIQKGVDDKYIAENYKLLAATNVSPTMSPGPALTALLKKWPHWSLKP